MLTLDRSLGDFEKADLLIEGTKIKAIAPNLDSPTALLIDASNMIVMPGFVDSHHHLWEGLLRNIAPDDSLRDYFFSVNGTFGPAYRPEDVYAGDLISALGTLNAGTTTVLDWSHIQNSPQHTDAAIQALRDSGTRTVFAYGFPAGRKWWQDPSHIYPNDIRRLRKTYFSSEDQLQTLALASNVFSASIPNDAVLNTWKTAREVGARITVHAGIADLDKGAVQAMGKAGVLGADVTYVHGNSLSDIEWKMIADTGGTISISCPVEMQMGIGRPAVQQALDHGIRPSLSVDCETQLPPDMFTQMRSVFSVQKAMIDWRALAGETNLPKMMKARDVLEFATIEGAKACGLDHKIGTLTPGKEADIVMLRTDSINVAPLNTAVGAVVLGMDTSNVDSVFVAGKLVKRDGQLLGVDMNRTRRLVQQSRDYVVSHTGFHVSRV